MSEATTTEAPEGPPPPDGPLLDLTDAGVKKFIKQAKARGYVTMDELNKVLPSEEVTSEAIEDTLAMLSEMGVNVIEAEEDAPEATEVAVREETQVAATEEVPHEGDLLKEGLHIALENRDQDQQPRGNWT